MFALTHAEKTLSKAYKISKLIYRNIAISNAFVGDNSQNISGGLRGEKPILFVIQEIISDLVMNYM